MIKNEKQMDKVINVKENGSTEINVFSHDCAEKSTAAPAQTDESSKKESKCVCVLECLDNIADLLIKVAGLVLLIILIVKLCSDVPFL